ncbi:MAG: hypothetical protein FJW94_04535 [Actinobacteria bacterium]|nr:hypothetical protein [Actinomycetota bacterium]
MSELLVPDSIAAPPTRSELVIDGLREPGVDLVAARHRVEVASTALRRRMLLTGAGVLLAAVIVGLVIWTIGRVGDDVETVAEESTTTVATSTTFTIPEAVSVTPVTTSSTVPAAAGVAPPAEPTSRSPLSAQLSVARGVSVGAPFTLAIDWNDADHAAAAAPSVTIEWNDPFLAAAAAEPPDAVCSAAGSPRAGRIERAFRYSTPGPRTIRVRLRSCGGTGPFGEDVTTELPLDVGGVAGVPLVAAVDSGAGDPDAAGAVRYASDTGGVETLANRSDAIDQVLRRDRTRRATVLISSAWNAGDVVLLRFPDDSCRWASLGTEGSSVAAVLTQQGCQPPRPTTTTVPVSITAPSTTTPPSSTTSTTSP